MREMILNHASFVPAGWHEAVDSLRGVASGMAALVNGGAAQPILRMQRKVTPESQSVRDYKKGKLLEARRFRAASGERVLFEWHARFGGGARIHLRFDARVREIEIGYVGVHLPMPPP